MFKSRIPHWRWFAGLVVLALFAIVTQRVVGWRVIVQTWSTMAPGITLVALALLVGSYLARAARIYHGFDGARFMPCVRIVLVHTASNNLLPVRTGEMAFPVLMKRTFAVSAEVAIPRLLWFRALDALFLVALAGVLVAGRQLGGPAPALLAAVCLVTCIVVLRILYAVRAALAGRLAAHGGRFARLMLRLLEGMPETGAAQRRLEFWTAVTWTLKLAGFGLILRELADLDAVSAVLGAVGGEVSSVLPIHGLAGAGTYEAGMLAVLTPLRVAIDQALPAAVTLHLFILGASVLGLVPALLPLPWWRPKTEKT